MLTLVNLNCSLHMEMIVKKKRIEMQINHIKSFQYEEALQNGPLFVFIQSITYPTTS